MLLKKIQREQTQCSQRKRQETVVNVLMEDRVEVATSREGRSGCWKLSLLETIIGQQLLRKEKSFLLTWETRALKLLSLQLRKRKWSGGSETSQISATKDFINTPNLVWL